jgi:hypothetical protein
MATVMTHIFVDRHVFLLLFPTLQQILMLRPPSSQYQTHPVYASHNRLSNWACTGPSWRQRYRYGPFTLQMIPAQVCCYH